MVNIITNTSGINKPIEFKIVNSIDSEQDQIDR